ncbi:hypothetical protein [Levilactobacillus lindianensis]|uniref:hypothetical protein n=1 Tax=Levilactobacillus lindianensis TaxID=2486018 RepID=UPI000F741CD7|nr:hypothetical protein [Levilactobacillus lindianensis]
MAVLERIGWRYWLVSLGMGLVVPALATWIGISPVWRFGGLLIVINGLLAVMLGRWIFRRSQPGWWVIVWPVVYLIGSMLFLPQYTRYFAIVYLCLSYLGYGLTQTKKSVES